MADQPLFQPVFAGEVHQQKAQYDGQQSLAGDHEHDQAGHNKKTAQQVLGGYEEYLKYARGEMTAGWPVPGRGKIVRRNADDEPGDHHQRTDESKQRGNRQPSQQNLVGFNIVTNGGDKLFHRRLRSGPWLVAIAHHYLTRRGWSCPTSIARFR